MTGKLPFGPPLPVMLAKPGALPDAADGSYLYEPKWDGFRALVFKMGDQIYLQSRDEKPLARYFPELDAPLRANLPERCVLDGEIVIATGDQLDFEALLLRIHPAESRIKILAADKPASFVAWDLLAEGDEDLRPLPQAMRRARLERVLAAAQPPIYLTPMTHDPAIAHDWFQRFEGAGLDGVIAKPAALPYTPGKRVMTKIKHVRTAECVVGGFRWYKGGKGTLVGSLLLGLYDDAGRLHHVGVTSAFKQADRAALAERLAPLRIDAADDHPWKDWAAWTDSVAPAAEATTSAASTDAPAQRKPGAKSRWTQKKDMSWIPIKLGLVCEVGYDHLQGTRFRHATHFKRWRPDKPAADCRYDQLDVTPAFELASIFQPPRSP
ncbi:MAG: ATP-dependent DNA ligase [Proteobacteria bacterium]|nr:ATP-dependent DNA ligase [Pseudomonadota bacterium]